MAVALTTELTRRGHQVQVVARVSDGRRLTVLDVMKPSPPFAPEPLSACSVAQYRFTNSERLYALPSASLLVPKVRQMDDRWVGRRIFFRRARMMAGAIDRCLRPFDVVVVLGGSDLAAAGAMVARKRGRASVVTPYAHPGMWDADALSGEGYRLATAVVAQSPVDADVYRGLGVWPDRLHEIASSGPRILPGRGERVRAMLTNRGPLVLFLGRRQEYKGFGLLLAAAPVVATERPDATIAFVGPGPPVPDMPGLGRAVIDVGAVTEQDKADWLAAADVLCLPSRAESFGLAVGEGWQAECAAVTSDIPTLRYLVHTAGGGVVAPLEPRAFARELLRLLSQPEEIRAAATRGRAWYERIAPPEAMAGAYERLFDVIEVPAPL